MYQVMTKDSNLLIAQLQAGLLLDECVMRLLMSDFYTSDFVEIFWSIVPHFMGLAECEAAFNFQATSAALCVVHPARTTSPNQLKLVKLIFKQQAATSDHFLTRYRV